MGTRTVSCRFGVRRVSTRKIIHEVNCSGCFWWVFLIVVVIAFAVLIIS